MVSKTQVVKFEAYSAFTNKNGDEEFCDISNLLDEIKNESLEDREINYFGEIVRMDNIHDIIPFSDTPVTDRIIYFHMTKLRDEGIATTGRDTEELTDLELDNDEYVAEDVNGFFDVELKTIFLQRNFRSLSISGLDAYLVKEYSKIHDLKKDDEDLSLIFNPVANKEEVGNALKSDNVREIRLKYASKNKNVLSKTFMGMLGNIGDTLRSVGGNNMEIVISMGTDKKSLNKIQSKKLIKDVTNGNSILSSAMIRGKAGDAPVEVYDLLNAKLSTKHKFSSVKDENGKTKKMHLNPSAVEDIMKLIYLRGDDTNSDAFRLRIIKNL